MYKDIQWPSAIAGWARLTLHLYINRKYNMFRKIHFIQR